MGTESLASAGDDEMPKLEPSNRDNSPRSRLVRVLCDLSERNQPEMAPVPAVGGASLRKERGALAPWCYKRKPRKLKTNQPPAPPPTPKPSPQLTSQKKRKKKTDRPAPPPSVVSLVYDDDDQTNHVTLPAWKPSSSRVAADERKLITLGEDFQFKVSGFRIGRPAPSAWRYLNRNPRGVPGILASTLPPLSPSRCHFRPGAARTRDRKSWELDKQGRRRRTSDPIPLRLPRIVQDQDQEEEESLRVMFCNFLAAVS